jgi:RNA polymerase sigma factor (sigma-70 family)
MTEALSDWDLISACRSGSASAWEQLVVRYERLVYSIALSYGLSRDDAADVAQTAFLALFRSLATLGDETRLSAWLATVAHRQARRLLWRGRHEHPDAIDRLAERLPGLGTGEGEPMERWELVEWLHLGLGSLSGRCRRLIMALYFDQAEPSYADVAARLGIALGSIGPTRARCLEQLRQFLQRSS